tara:strand:- start:209 stop:1063 length:855 start_codon:yes stop_codon:yes gene_type:complete
MKKLTEPRVNDAANIRKLSENSNATATFPHLKTQLNDILQQYQSYLDERGNALALRSLGIVDPLKRGMLSSYSKPPKAINDIGSLRIKSETCPMCGSEGTFSLDHIMPKEDFPEWAFFSRNLVPACHCNITRGRALKGAPRTQQRVLHPYFDEILQERLLSCSITSRNNFRWVDVKLVILNPQHPLNDAIKFHVDKIVRPAGIEKRLQRNIISKLMIKPSKVIRGLFEVGQLSADEVRRLIERDLRWYDQNKESPNNWDSIFLHGVLNSQGVVDWITDLHNRSQ